MSREWKSGDVAVSMGDRLIRTSEGCWSSENGQAGIRYTTQDPRPLVVIDPEDEDAAFRLIDLYFSGGADRLNARAMQAALREFADPKPSKPEEPTGLGAVVEDANGLLWMRGKSSSHLVWIDPTADFDNRHWGQIDAVKVLGDGIPA